MTVPPGGEWERVCRWRRWWPLLPRSQIPDRRLPSGPNPPATAYSSALRRILCASLSPSVSSQLESGRLSSAAAHSSSAFSSAWHRISIRASCARLAFVVSMVKVYGRLPEKTRPHYLTCK